MGDRMKETVGEMREGSTGKGSTRRGLSLRVGQEPLLRWASFVSEVSGEGEASERRKKRRDPVRRQDRAAGMGAAPV